MPRLERHRLESVKPAPTPTRSAPQPWTCKLRLAGHHLMSVSARRAGVQQQISRHHRRLHPHHIHHDHFLGRDWWVVCTLARMYARSTDTHSLSLSHTHSAPDSCDRQHSQCARFLRTAVAHVERASRLMTPSKYRQSMSPTCCCKPSAATLCETHRVPPMRSAAKQVGRADI